MGVDMRVGFEDVRGTAGGLVHSLLISSVLGAIDSLCCMSIDHKALLACLLAQGR